MSNKPGTINRKLDILKAVLNHVERRGWLSSVPKWNKLKAYEREGVYITQEMRETLINTMIKQGNAHIIDLSYCSGHGSKKEQFSSTQEKPDN